MAKKIMNMQKGEEKWKQQEKRKDIYLEIQ